MWRLTANWLHRPLALERSQSNFIQCEKAKYQPELIFGLVGPLGTDTSLVEKHLGAVLRQVGYRHETFRLSRLMREIPFTPWNQLCDRARDMEIQQHIAAGNELRRRLRQNDALALLGIGALREYRQNTGNEANRQLPGFAAISKDGQM